MAGNRVRSRVQNVYTWQKIISVLPYVNGRKPSLRTKAKAINESAVERGLPGRVTFMDVERLEHGREPKGKAKREVLGLPALGVGVLCARHGRVCAVQHCPPKLITRWRDLPVEQLRWAIENRKDYNP